MATVTGTSYSDRTVMGGATYHYTVLASDAAGNKSPPSNTLDVTTPSDTTPPSVTQVTAVAGSTTATVSWTTDEPASSQVLFGPTAGYGSSSARS